MKAKDTVMDYWDVKNLLPERIVDEMWGEGIDVCGTFEIICEAQAEISFKIGKTAGVAESLIPATKAVEASRKAGIKEVAEIVSKHIGMGEIDALYWQSKLKEWEYE